ncbi:MAG: ATP-binding protein [Oscillospiraceae bacterium]|nr:ATP-binding protein [Oscillospiraceae bacterium]
MYSIKRNIEPVIERRAKNSKAILLTGPRQVGKSTLFKHLFNGVNQVQVTFDDDLLLLQVTEDPEMFMLNNPPPLMIDEVQKCPAVFNRLKIYLDNTDKCANFFLTDSQKLQLMEEISESLAGRVSIVELDGLSTYLERDVNELIKARNHLTFVKFMTAIAARTGQILNYATIADQVGVSEVTIKEWISILEKSGIVYLLKPYTSSVLNRAIKTPKLYFRDTGLCSYLTRWLTPETLKNGAMSGAMFETFVISEILKSYSNEGLEYDFDVFYYNGKDKKKRKTDGSTEAIDGEIDLIIQEGDTLHPVEIKMSAMPKAIMASEFDILDGIPDKKRGMGAIICMHERKLYLRENLVALPFWYI